MKIIRPQAITDANLASSNIPETDHAAYSASTIYVSGDRVISTETHRIYESASGANLGAATVSIAAPGVVTRVGHGLSNGTPVLLTTTGSLPAGIAAGTIYYVTAATADTFQLAATVGGAAITTSGTQSGAHTLYSNPNKGFALTNPAKWIDVAPTNRWAMFDAVNSTATTAASQIDVTFALTGRVDSIALINVSAATIRVIVSDAVDGVVYDKTISMISTEGVTDWAAYFREEIIKITDYAAFDLPAYYSPTVRIIIDGEGDAVSCGTLVVGQSRSLGETLLGASVGIVDYSRKSVDDFGNTVVVERSFAKRGQFRIAIPANAVDEAQRILAKYRATPIIYSASEAYNSTLLLGFFKSFSIAIEYPTISYCEIEVEGLT